MMTFNHQLLSPALWLIFRNVASFNTGIKFWIEYYDLGLLGLCGDALAIISVHVLEVSGSIPAPAYCHAKPVSLICSILEA